jgi:hypothetical protein
MRRLRCPWLALILLGSAGLLCAQPQPGDPDLAAGIRSVEEGDLELSRGGEGP